MISDHEVMRRRDEREELAAKMAAWEATHGPVITRPPTDNQITRHIRLTKADRHHLNIKDAE